MRTATPPSRDRAGARRRSGGRRAVRVAAVAVGRVFPGWRLYLSHSAEEGRSFFRYRAPETGEIAISPDAGWHLRFFEVSAEPERPLWHAIHSDTDRFSIGWIVRPWSLRAGSAAGAARVASLARELAAAGGLALP